MLAAAGNARVARDLPTLGALRAIGFGWGALAGVLCARGGAASRSSQAAPGSSPGPWRSPARRATSCARSTSSAPPHLLGLEHLLALAVAVAGAVARGRAARLSRRAPPCRRALFAAPPIAAARRGAVVGRPVLLGARLALARPGRLAVAGVAVAASVAIVLLMLTLARFLVSAEKDPALLGERYTLLVPGGPGVFDRVLATPGVAAAADRYEVAALDGFDLGEPMQLVAFGPGRAAVFPGRPLDSGRRARRSGEAEIGQGLAESLGLALGGTLSPSSREAERFGCASSGSCRSSRTTAASRTPTPPALLRAQPEPRRRKWRCASPPGASSAAVAARLRPQGLHST